MFSPSSRFFQAAALLPLAAFSSAQPASTPDLNASTFTFHHENVLGTSLQITVRAASLSAASRAEAAILSSFDQDSAILSTWQPQSEASRWSRTALEPVPVSPELFQVLSDFDQWRDRTNGALDASVGAATRLWQQATEQGRVPTAQEIALTRESMQQPHWQLNAEHRTATRLSDIPLAFASFTKSFISSRAADQALGHGATGVMLNVGGDVIVRGELIQLVSIANPQADAENGRALQHIAVQNRAVATSGSYRRGFDLAATHFSHLIDPRTATPVDHILSSTVIASDAVTAGALATAFSVLTPAESQTLAATIPGIQYLLILPNGDQLQSPNWPARQLLTHTAYSTAPAAAGLWDPAFELSLDLTLPRLDDARYRRPYVAVWLEDADHFPVRTLALWTQNPRWLPELKVWYREDQVRTLAEGSDVSRTISSATRAPGHYSLKWDGKDNEGKPVKAGRYTVCVEASREHGGYDIQRQALDFSGKPQQAALPAARELGAVTLDYHKR